NAARSAGVTRGPRKRGNPRPMAAARPGAPAPTSVRRRATIADRRRTRHDEPPPYINRELSWLGVNARGPFGGRDARNPLLERAKFLAIFASNLDEFFQVRVAGLKQQAAAHAATVSLSPDGRLPAEQLALIRERVVALVAEHSALWAVLREELAEA